MPRPYALAPGAGFFCVTWVVGLGIARLTGAAAVVLMLAATAAGLVAALVEGWWAAGRVDVVAVTAPELVTATEPVTVIADVAVRRRRSRGARLVLGSADGRHVVFGEQSVDGQDVAVTARFPEPGIVDAIEVAVETAGASGLVWWRRRFRLDIDPIFVAPRPSGPLIAFDQATNADAGEGSSRLGTSSGEVDGVRPWREGEGAVGVHWPSTMRAGALIVHDRHVASDTSWIVPADDSDVARLRYTLDEGLRAGHTVSLRRTHPAANPTIETVHSPDDAARMSAIVAASQPNARAATTPWWKRDFHLGATPSDELRNPERVLVVTRAARWVTALTAFLGLAMLVTALDGSPATVGMIALGLVLGALVTIRFVDESGNRPLAVRIGVVVAAVGALAYIAVDASGIGGLLAALRGPLPDLLMLLVVLHGFEVTTRRTMRVHQAIALIVAVYAAGLRIDGQLGWWIAAWGVAFVAAITLTSFAPVARTHPAARTGHPLRSVVGWGVLAIALALALSSIVPIPDGPASLGLPALSTGASVDTPGALAAPDGSPAASSPDDGTRGSLGQVGGYPGFSETLDTSVRGDLGDQIVMRVRSPEPAFWRGQTFTDFDGRTWRVSPETGSPQDGPNIAVPPTLGDEANPMLESDELIQTYFVEADLPNVLFAAHRATDVIFDGTVWTRPDGALRSDVTLEEGSVYTVVSERIRVTPGLLRSQGDVAEVFAAFDDAASQEVLAPYLELPPSTSARTLELAAALNPTGQSTYDTILRYEAWLEANTAYDLNAPVPAEGVDAVDDFLFASQRGFCEQIASALTVMLRSQGVPARLATGYLPGERDRVSGVWKVRASDAHAWVEVWFPETGWQAFDPTASVPLAGEAQVGTVGSDLVSAALSSIASYPVEVGAVVAAGLALVAATGILREGRRRRQRGRWGRAQDRFIALADRLGPDGSQPVGSGPVGSVQFGAPPTNPQRGERIRSRLDDPAAPADADAVAHAVEIVVDALDRAAFDPAWVDGTAEADVDYGRTIAALESLERITPPARQLTCS